MMVWFIRHANSQPSRCSGAFRGLTGPRVPQLRLGLHVMLLLLVLSELRLDGDGGLLSLGGAHVDVEVLRDVLLGCICGEETTTVLFNLNLKL